MTVQRPTIQSFASPEAEKAWRDSHTKAIQQGLESKKKIDKHYEVTAKLVEDKAAERKATIEANLANLEVTQANLISTQSSQEAKKATQEAEKASLTFPKLK